MKKLMIAVAVALFGFSDAQIKTGTVYVSGQVNYNKEENKSSNSTEQTFKIIPTAGIFVAPNLAIGTGLGYTQGKSDYTQAYYSGPFTTFIDYTGKTNAITVAPFVRKYWTLSERLYIFGQLQVPMEFGKINQDAVVTYANEPAGYVEQQTLSYETKYTSIGVNIKPGLDYFLNKNWSLETTIGEFGYKNLKYKDADDRNGKNYNFGVNLSSVSFGVKYIFAK